MGRIWAVSERLWRKAAVNGSLRSALRLCAPNLGPLHPIEMETPHGQALKDQPRSNAVHRAAHDRPRTSPVDRTAAPLSEELVAGPPAALSIGGAVMHGFHPYSHRSSCWCQQPYCMCERPYWRCSRCEIYWSLVELLVALVLLFIFVVAAAHLRA
jgi:hypothetical protein